ncbi:hypothetical protein IFM89_028592 [Coptis chinensis]|uniref:Cupin type-1 domain-containing protein n=1 Tax=Coptis chinensis TaxID=261450 RepID=A0A835IE30_9MAGN|nr:hypothetical protein IFM89_028592 [Coptis chinensis]
MRSNSLVTNCPEGENICCIMSNGHVVRSLKKFCIVEEIFAKKVITGNVAFELYEVFVNGSCCKDPALATGDDFYLSGLHLAGNTSNLQGSAVIPANVAQIPGLNTLSISMVRIDFRPNGLNPPHTHPRATEILVVLEVHFTLDSSPPAPVTGSSPKP